VEYHHVRVKVTLVYDRKGRISSKKILENHHLRDKVTFVFES
jgi:hypothetical protein